MLLEYYLGNNILDWPAFLQRTLGSWCVYLQIGSKGEVNTLLIQQGVELCMGWFCELEVYVWVESARLN